MAVSRSRFYVDTPPSMRDPSQRHSMFAELGHGPSSSATLPPPSPSGSVDHLSEKKKSRFFTLKPKSLSSLKPFFSSSTSIASLSPSKRRKVVRRDSSAQTDPCEARPEVGVQTLNASTVDVPVQTCSREWEEADGRAFFSPFRPGYTRRPAAGYSAYRTTPAASKAPENAARDHLGGKKSSGELSKYPSDSTASCQTADSNDLSAAAATSVNNPPESATSLAGNSSAPQSCGGTHASVCGPQPVDPVRRSAEPVRVETPKKSADYPTAQFVKVQNQDCIIAVPSSNSNSTDCASAEKTIAVKHLSESTEDTKPEVSSVPFPPPALKLERTDSPSRFGSKAKSVHFELSEPSSLQCSKEEKPLPRDVEKEFEALLKDLDILTEEPEPVEPHLTLNCNPVESQPKPNCLSPTLKFALDVLRQDFLAPILESTGESPEIGEKTDTTVQNNPSDNLEKPLLNETDKNTQVVNPDSADFVDPNPEPPTTPQVYDENKPENIKGDSPKLASPVLFTCAKKELSSETGFNPANIYDCAIKKDSCKPVTLPTPPSFFQSPPVPSDRDADCSQDFSGEFDIKDMPLEGNADRSSSRNTSRSNSLSSGVLPNDVANRFDSCENLDQLEEEFIRNLCGSTEMNEPTQPLNESLLPSTRNASHVRRAILDRLLSGESVDEILPCQTKSVILPTPDIVSVDIRDKDQAKPGKKYVATITRMESENARDFFGKIDCPENAGQNINSHSPNLVKEWTYPSAVPKESDSLQKSSMSLIPEATNSSGTPESATLEISYQNKAPPALEVRRSSWTSQPTNSNPSPSPTSAKLENQESKQDDGSSAKCDFSNCLRPSRLQNSPFLAQMNSKSMSPRMSPEMSFHHRSDTSNSPKRQESPAKHREPGQCDYANCLKPSQVQNSLFTAELSEITAGRSPILVNGSHQTNSPLPARSCSPFVTITKEQRPFNAIQISVDNKSDECVDPEPSAEVRHKSEVRIMLQPTLPLQSLSSNGAESMVNKDSQLLQNSKPESVFKPVVTPEMSVLTEAQLAENQQTSSTENSGDTIQNVNVPQSVVPPPPPPPPPPVLKKEVAKNRNQSNGGTMESMIVEQRSNLTSPPEESRPTRPRTPMIAELEKKFESVQKMKTEQTMDANEKQVNDVGSLSNNDKRYENGVRAPLNFYPTTNTSGLHNGSNGFLSDKREFNTSLSNGKNENSFGTKLEFAPNSIITDQPPPPGAVLLEKKVTVEGDKVHTDKYYAIPVQEVLKEKTTVTKFIPAPPKYEGIGPTEDGIPIAPRNSVKKENMHNWYKTMFKSLHKADTSNDTEEYIIGYSSEPETSQKDKLLKKKSATLDNRSKYDNSFRSNNNLNRQDYPPSAKSSIEVYKVRPRLIEDYEPGYSSVTDDMVTTGSKRFLPSSNVPKPSYQFKNGYESDSCIMKKAQQPEVLSSEEQKVWYREVQKGADIPQFGLGKPAPEKPKEPMIGPLPPPPLNYSTQPTYQQAIRPTSLPDNYANQNGNGLCQQMNGAYEVQMRQAIHSEMSQRLSPSSYQLSPPIRSTVKSPSRSPDLKLPARALFNFKAESPKEISLQKGDVLLVLRQLDKNWYEGEHRGRIGIFPISYVEIIPPEHAVTPVKAAEGIAKALYDFTAQTPIELTVKKGDLISVLRRIDANWYEGRFNNKKGIVPVSYLQVIQEPPATNMKSLSPRSYNSSPRSASETKETAYKTNSISPSSFSPNTSPQSVTSGKGILQNRSKKSSSLIEPVMYRALYSYTPQNADELELAEGDAICVVEMCDDGWYVGTSVRTGVLGIFPGNYVEKA